MLSFYHLVSEAGYLEQCRYNRYKIGLFLILVLLVKFVNSPPLPEFVVEPLSVNCTTGQHITIPCSAANASTIEFLVNGIDADSDIVEAKGFKVGSPYHGDTIQRNLTVVISVNHNNSNVTCVGINEDKHVESRPSYILVQGPLSSVGDLSSSFINSSTINISWSPPFTLPGTAITGYNISVISNGTTTNYFTSDIYYVIQLSDITDYPCNEINITVSGYNGLDGERRSIVQQLQSCVSKPNNFHIPLTSLSRYDGTSIAGAISSVMVATTSFSASLLSTTPSRTPSLAVTVDDNEIFLHTAIIIIGTIIVIVILATMIALIICYFMKRHKSCRAFASGTQKQEETKDHDPQNSDCTEKTTDAEIPGSLQNDDSKNFGPSVADSGVSSMLVTDVSSSVPGFSGFQTPIKKDRCTEDGFQLQSLTGPITTSTPLQLGLERSWTNQDCSSIN